VTVYFVPIGAVLAAITFFWIYGAENAREQVNVGAAKPLGKWFEPMGKYVFTGVSILVIIMSFIYKGI
jgi:NSS family neurotransmitter:Na+ symporter